MLVVFALTTLTGCEDCLPPSPTRDAGTEPHVGPLHESPVRVQVTAVLPEQPEFPWRAYGSKRFFEVSFVPAGDDLDPIGSTPAADKADPERKSVQPELLRVCRPDTFFVDLPRYAPLQEPGDDPNLPTPPAAFSQHLATELTRWLNQGRRYEWVFGRPTDLASDPQGTPQPMPGFCGEPAPTSNKLFVREAVLCDAVQAVRDAAVRAYQATVPKAPADGALRKLMRIGRLCSFGPQGVQEQACSEAEVLTWHFRRIGLSPPRVGDEDVELELALIDSGLEPDFGTLGLVAEEVSGADPFTGQRVHVHGTQMALLARHVVGDRRVQLRSYRIFNVHGESTPNHLARALDLALYGPGVSPAIVSATPPPQGKKTPAPAPPRHPLVVNLSVGWPPELGAPRGLTGWRGDRDADGSISWQQCQTMEDPVGSPVDYLIRTTRLLNDNNVRPVLVVAAAGNRPDPNGDDRKESRFAEGFGVVPRGTGPGDATDKRGQPQWFYPAQFARQRAPLGSEPLVVGAVTDTEAPTALSIPRAEPALVAPGQHVYVTSIAAGHCPGGPLPSDACPKHPEYGGCDCPGLHVPHALTGTSVATALVSAVAARAQLVRMSNGLRPLSGPRLAALLYHTADPLIAPGGAAGGPTWRTSVVGAPVRRLSLRTMDAWLGDPALLDQKVPPTLPGPPLDGPGVTAAPPTSWTPPDAVLWKPTYTPSPSTLTGGLSTAPPATWVNESANPPPDAPWKDFFSLAGLGPLPPGVHCPECNVWGDRLDGTKWTIMSAALELSDPPSGTTYLSALIKVKSSGVVWKYAVDPALLKPGVTITIDLPDKTLPGSIKAADAWIVIERKSPWVGTYSSTDPLRILYTP